MNGISDMVHNRALARVSKDETLETPGQYSVFDYIITHEPDLHEKNFLPVQGIKGWAGLRSQIPQIKKALLGGDASFFVPSKNEAFTSYVARILPLQPRWEELVWIMRNKQRTGKHV